MSSPSVSLEFAETENRGMVLPWVTSTGAVTGVADGSFVYDLSDHKVKSKICIRLERSFCGCLAGTTVDPITLQME
ncbi:hypothetical protein [Chryseobacterium indoltheticum]|uniref:hypothetical protein n=1 Tax=Chryseobacterium indoltheticum TaxID=254 RepID=UPI003F49344C